MNTPNKTMPAPTAAEEILELRLLARTVGLNDEQTARFRLLMRHEVEELDRSVAAVGESRVAHAKALEEIEARLDAPLVIPSAEIDALFERILVLPSSSVATVFISVFGRIQGTLEVRPSSRLEDFFTLVQDCVSAAEARQAKTNPPFFGAAILGDSTKGASGELITSEAGESRSGF